MGPKSLARSAVWADGLAGFDLGARSGGGRRDVPAGRGRVDRRGPRRAGRGSRRARWFALGDGAAERLRGYAYDYLSNFGDARGDGDGRRCAGSPIRARCGRRSRRSRETGCDEFVLVPTTDDIAELDRLLDGARRAARVPRHGLRMSSSHCSRCSSPRVAIFFVVGVHRPDERRVRARSGSGLLGFILLPWTTLAWALVYAPVRGVTGLRLVLRDPRASSSTSARTSAPRRPAGEKRDGVALDPVS